MILGEYARHRKFQDSLEKLRTGDTANLKKFFTNCLCTNSTQHLDEYLQNYVPLQQCNDMITYEASTHRVYMGQQLDLKQNSKFKPLTSYLNQYVDELEKQHKNYFLKDGDDFLKNFDQLGCYYIIYYVTCPFLLQYFLNYLLRSPYVDRPPSSW